MSKEDIEICLAKKDNLEAILNSVADGIITLDNDFIITNMNNAASRLLKISHDNAIGKNCLMIMKNSLSVAEKIIMDVVNNKKIVKNHRLLFVDTSGVQRRMVIHSAILRDKLDEIKGAVIVFRDESELYRLRKRLDERLEFQGIVGKSKNMQEIYKLIEDVAASDASTLIYGESGTGKELAAKAIHFSGKRKDGPFVTVNCSALSEHLLESELFGHVKGAFTGAVSDKKGRFELADKGTLFLDEIGEISQSVQVKLLRVLQEKVIEKVGDATPFTVDVRIISATNKNLKILMGKADFREDLYYRLKVISINLPPLRERKDDIVLLVERFIEKYNLQTGKEIISIDDEVLELFMRYSWNGNIRELSNAIEHAFVLCKGDVIIKKDLPVEISVENIDFYASSNNSSFVGLTEKDKIIKILNETGWNKSKAARFLKINRTTLWRKMQDFSIIKP